MTTSTVSPWTPATIAALSVVVVSLALAAYLIATGDVETGSALLRDAAGQAGGLE